MPILAKLNINILIKPIKVLLQLLFPDLIPFKRVRRVIINVCEQDRLRELRLDVFSGTAVAVSTGADFEVESAVDAVLLRSAKCQLCTSEDEKQGAH